MLDIIIAGACAIGGYLARPYIDKFFASLKKKES